MRIGSVRRPQQYFEYTLSGRQAGETLIAKAKRMNGKAFPKETDPFVGTFIVTEADVVDIDGNLVPGWSLKLDISNLPVGEYIFNEIINGVVEEPVSFSILESVTS